METVNEIIAESTEFVCENWGQGELGITYFAPVTRDNGTTWVHATLAREGTLEEMRRRATRIWRVTGSLWNPTQYTLIWRKP